MKKGKKYVKRVILCLLLALVVGAGILSQELFYRETSDIQVEESLEAATVSRGNISRSLSAAGTIAETQAQSVSLAGDVEIESWLVKNGDYVQQGQELAILNAASLNAAIKTVTESIALLDKDLESSRLDAVDTELRAGMSGTVIAVYAQTGDDVLTVMNRYGCLALLSLDGLLAADVEAEGLAVGDPAVAILSDGAEVSGQVSNVSGSTVSITIDQSQARLGDSVTLCSQGKTLGHAELYVNRAVKVSGYWGRVAYANVQPGDSVRSGQILLSLENTVYTGRRDHLLSQREILEEQLSRLYEAEETGTLRAEYNGRISEIPEETLNLFRSSELPTKVEQLPQAVPTTASCFRSGQQSGTAGNHGFVLLSSLQEAEAEKKQVVAQLQSMDETTILLSVLNSGETLCVAKEILVSGGVDLTGLAPGAIYLLSYEGDQLVSFSSFGNQEDSAGTEQGPDGGNGQQDGSQFSGNGAPGASGGTMGGAGGAMGGAGGAMTGAGGEAVSNGAEKEEAEDYLVQETVFCSITQYEKAEITLSVDQRDIASYALGLHVNVTLDALPGESFDGVVTEIDPVGASSGSGSSSGFYGNSSGSETTNTKYSVTVMIDRRQDMLSGMNCNTYLSLGDYEDLLLIPCAALHEDKTGTFVYTGYDEKKDALTDPVYVETGSSDGEKVEICSGLQEGQSVFYRYAKTLRYQFMDRPQA